MPPMTPEDPAMPPPEGDPAMQEPPAEQVPDQPAGDQQASPEEQAAYEDFVAHGLLLIYSEKMLPQVVKMLKGGNKPEEGLASATALIVSRLISAAEKAQKLPPGDVVFHAGVEIFQDLAELSGKAQIKDYGEDKDALESAFFNAADQLRTTLQGSGKIDQAAASADMERLQQMDQSGELQAMFEELAAKDDEGGGGEMPPPEDQPRGLAMGIN